MMDDLRRRAGRGSFTPKEGVDVDLVLLRSLGLEPDFSWMPEGFLGRTTFSSSGRAEVQISRQLCEEAMTDALARRRLRTTLAHEIGHVACHPQLFFADTSTLALFPGKDQGSGAQPVMCRAESVDRPRYDGEWWEYQANQCMAALLMPQRLFHPRLDAALAASGVPTFSEAIKTGTSLAVVRALSDYFDVSQAAVYFRLKKFGHVPPEH